MSSTKDDVERFHNPLNGIKTKLLSENRTITFRKEEFQIRSLYYERCDTKQKFTTTELDEINLNQVYNQYRVEHGIPFTDEIVSTREKYGL